MATASSSSPASIPPPGCGASTHPSRRSAGRSPGSGSTQGRVAFKRGRSRALPYPDRFFDLAAQAGGRLHPGEIARVLRPGGHAILIGEWRWLDWRLGGRGFDPVATGEAEGERFHVLRLHADERAPE